MWIQCVLLLVLALVSICFKDEQSRIFEVRAVMGRCLDICVRQVLILRGGQSFTCNSMYVSSVITQIRHWSETVLLNWLEETCVQMHLLCWCKLRNCEHSFVSKLPLVADVFLRYWTKHSYSYLSMGPLLRCQVHMLFFSLLLLFFSTCRWGTKIDSHQCLRKIYSSYWNH